MEETGSNYLALISNQAMLDGTLTTQDIEEIQSKLWILLAQRTQRYTMDESSSVPTETAEELLKSISFTLSLTMKAVGVQPLSLLKAAALQELLQAGWTEIEAQIALGKTLLQQVTDSAPELDNLSYRDTLAGIEIFFKKYDYRFFAHEIPCDIDYQLCHPVSEVLQGIEYINAYLRHLLIENEFCNAFDTGIVIALLKSYCPDYRGLLINLYEPLAVNAIGLALLGEEIHALEITDCGRNDLLNYFQGRTRAEAMEALKDAAAQVSCQIPLEDASARDYLQRVALDLLPRIQAALPQGSLDGIFLSLCCA